MAQLGAYADVLHRATSGRSSARGSSALSLLIVVSDPADFRGLIAPKI